MDTYKDYQRYKEDNSELLKTIKQNAEGTYLLISDIIDVLDYTAKEAEKNTKLEPELLEIFDYGYAFLSAFLTEMEFIYHDYFNGDNLLLKKYDKLLSYWFYIHDLCTYIEAEINENEEEKLQSSLNELDESLAEIDEMMKELKEIKNEYYDYLEEKISKNNPDLKHKDTFTIFSLIREDVII